jgi:hypothetical protein
VTDYDALSVNEFCARHRISVQLFYKNRKQMPRTFNVGKRVLISREAAAAWRHLRKERIASHCSSVNRKLTLGSGTCVLVL